MLKIEEKQRKFAIGLSLLVVIVVIALACTFIPGSNTRYGTVGLRKMDRGTSMTTSIYPGDYDGGENYRMMDSEQGYAVGSVASSAPMADSYAPSEPNSMTLGGKTAAEAEQRIIKTADLAISVDGVENKTAAINALATGRGGFVQDSTMVEDLDGYKSSYITVRVPSDVFEETVNAIKELSVRVDRESINGRDVTEQYTDLEARLRSAKAQEEQYLVILEKAETVPDILSVQSYLQGIRYEIESLQGQIDSLGNQTAYSTISVSLSEEVRVQVPAEKFDLMRDVKLAFRYVVLLAQALITSLVWIIIVGGAILIPTVIIIILAVTVIRKIASKF